MKGIPGIVIPEALRTLGKDRATVKYPVEEHPRAERFRGRVDYETDPCTGCGLCERNCPSNAITVEQEDGTVTWSYNLGHCLYCGQCEEVCPPGAIEMSGNFELASSDVDSFQETYQFEQ